MEMTHLKVNLNTLLLELICSSFQIFQKSLLTHQDNAVKLPSIFCHLMVSGQQFVTFAVLSGFWTADSHPPGIIFQVLTPLS
jgi:hypothetical protein